MRILDIKGLQILDSRGNPTLQVDVILDEGSKGTFQVPSGASTGIHEACELRDEDENNYHGKSVEKCLKNIELIKEHFLDKEFTQEELDKKLILFDGSENKSVLGANTILGVSVAFAKASAKYYSLPTYEYINKLYLEENLSKTANTSKKQIHLFSNVINGGLHSGNNLQIQEFMLVPMQDSMQEKVKIISETYQTLKKLIKDKYGPSSTSLGDEGGFAPEISKPSEALDLLVNAINTSGHQNNVGIAIDCAASDFYNSKTKKYKIEKNKNLDYKELTVYYNELVNKYPIIAVEDPMAEYDFDGFSYYMKNKVTPNKKNIFSDKKELLVIGDDLLVTNPRRIQEAQKKKLCNSLLLKINQIGTLSESFDSARLAQKKNWHIVVSHRSGETTDSFIADLAVALSSSIKLGAPARGERTAKFNRLLEIYR